MFKIKLIFFALSLLTPLMGNLKAPIRKTYVVNSDLYGPFEVFQEDVEITLKMSSIVKLSIYEEFAVKEYGDDNYRKFTFFPHHVMELGNEPYLLNYKLPLENYFSSKGMSIRFRIYKSDDSILQENCFDIFPIIDRWIMNINKYKDEPFLGRTMCFQFSGNDVLTPIETTQFKNVLDYFDINYYNHLSFKNSYIDFITPFEFYGKAELIIYDYKKAFPHLSRNEEDEIHIPLKLTYEDNKVYFDINSLFYVNPDTLESSKVYRSNWILSSYLYFPINKEEDVMSTRFMVLFNELGLEKLTFGFNVSLNTDRNFLGLCSNSEYCVQGGIKA